jgi:hypothetical protein
MNKIKYITLFLIIGSLLGCRYSFSWKPDEGFHSKGWSLRSKESQERKKQREQNRSEREKEYNQKQVDEALLKVIKNR